MREIKFRCWNAHANVMHNWDELVAMNKIHLLANQQASYPIMQFTGLKDVNGVEIYEGDIVEIEYSVFERFPWSDEETLTGSVQYIDGSYLVGNKTKGDCLFQETATVKVIGNIHQNPELLEKCNG